MNDSTSTDDLLARRSLRRRGSSRHSFPAGVQSGTGTSATPQGMDLASTTTLKTPEVKSAAMLTQQGSGITLSGLSGSSTTEQEARVLTLVDDPIVGDGSPPPPPPPDADVGGARGTTPRVFQAQTRRQQRTSSQSSLGSAAATEGKEGSSSSTTTMGTLVFGTPVAAASSASSSSAAPGGRSRVHTAAVVGARDSMELQQPPAQDEKKEVRCCHAQSVYCVMFVCAGVLCVSVFAGVCVCVCVCWCIYVCCVCLCLYSHGVARPGP